MNDTGLEHWRKPLHRNAILWCTERKHAGPDGAGLLYQGYVETSNVNVAEELVNMIQVQRAYEINSKAVSTTDQMLQKLTQLWGLTGGRFTGLLILKMIAMQKRCAYAISSLLVLLTGCAGYPPRRWCRGDQCTTGSRADARRQRFYFPVCSAD